MSSLRCQHYAALRLELKAASVLKVQLIAQLERGVLTPSVQLLSLTPTLDICVEHRRCPEKCFVKKSEQNTLQQEYENDQEYRYQFEFASERNRFGYLEDRQIVKTKKCSVCFSLLLAGISGALYAERPCRENERQIRNVETRTLQERLDGGSGGPVCVPRGARGGRRHSQRAHQLAAAGRRRAVHLHRRVPSVSAVLHGTHVTIPVPGTELPEESIRTVRLSLVSGNNFHALIRHVHSSSNTF